MAEELIKLRIDLSKAVTDANSPRVKDILDSVKDLPVTVTTLKDSKIGFVVNKLRTSDDANIASSAKAVYTKWKNVYSEYRNEIDSKRKAVASPHSNADSEKNVSTSTSPIKTTTNTTVAETTSFPKTNNQMRDFARSKFFESFCATRDAIRSDGSREEIHALTLVDVGKLAADVESELYSLYSIPGSKEYKTKFRSLRFNLGTTSPNPDLRRQVVLGTIKADKLVNMDWEQMGTDAFREKVKSMKEYALRESKGSVGEQATTDQFRCGRCGKRECTYYQMQTRSADEPMTTFVTCVNCKNHWKC